MQRESMEPTSKKWQVSSLMKSVMLISVFSIVVAFVSIGVTFFSKGFFSKAGKVKRIDTHAHFLPPFYYDLLESKGLSAGGRANPKWSAADHLKVMDSLNIGLSVLSVSAPGASFKELNVEESRKLARELNEYGHMLTLEHPERFQFFATLTLPDVEGSVAEAIYSLDTLKAAGVVLLASSRGEYLGSPNFDPLMEVLNARKATAFIHPHDLDLAPVINDVGGGQQVKLDPYVIDFLLDTTRAAQNLIVMKVTRRYPNIKFILSHSGGFMPFAAFRMAGAISGMLGESPFRSFRELQKFYVDTALSSSVTALPSTLAMIPHNQITFGSDYPYAPIFGIERAVGFYEDFALEDEVRDNIDFHCANGLLKKPLSHWRSVWHKDTDTS